MGFGEGAFVSVRPRRNNMDTQKAKNALMQLLLAYAKGESAGHVEWEDLDLARDMAEDALPGEYERILERLN
jgi:hypothetical protein